MGVGSIKIQPMNAKYGEDKAQVVKVTTVKDTSGSLGGRCFMLYGVNSSGSLVKNYVWLDTGSSTDPAIAGHTGIQVSISSNDTATAVASAIATAVNADANYNATSTGNVVTITCQFNGYAPKPRDATAVAKQTGFGFEMSTQGSKEEDLGLLDGDIEWSLSKSMVDITAHQRGAEVLGGIMNGTECEVTLTLKETTKEKLLKALYGQGGSHIPDGVDGSELVGFGQFKNFDNAEKYAMRLVLHPVQKLPSDKSEDVCFWKAFPMLESLTFSGENIQTIPVTFKIYPDLNKPDPIQHFAIGDWTQMI